MSFIFAPVLAAVAALTVTTKVDVPIARVYVPIVVFGSGVWQMQNDRVSSVNGQDVTDQQIADSKALVAAAGFAEDRIDTWRQNVNAFAFRPGDKTSINVGVLVLDLGTPDDARKAAPLLMTLRGKRGIAFGWNPFVSVNCASLESLTHSQLDGAARERLLAMAPNDARARVQSLTLTTDPRTGPFDAVPLCPVGQHPAVHSAMFGGLPTGSLVGFGDSFRRFASANVMMTYAPVSAPAVAPPNSTAQFPFGTFGFPVPIIGHQNRALALRGGRFAALPGASSVSTPVEGAMIAYLYREPEKYAQAVRDVGRLVSASDYFADDVAKRLYVRLRPVTPQRYASLDKLYGGNSIVYRFLTNCAPYRQYAHALAIGQTRALAQAAAETLKVPLGPLAAQTDWAGAGSDVTCGSDGSGDMAALVTLVNAIGQGSSGEPYYADFSDSIYAAWTLGAQVPVVASSSLVERLVPVIASQKSGTQVTGTATLVPDAYFEQHRDNNTFSVSILAPSDAKAKNTTLGNVVTDCEAAQERALQNAIKVALFDGPVGSLYAQPARLLSVACLRKELIGQTFSAITMYFDSSPTGAPQATDSITVYR